MRGPRCRSLCHPWDWYSTYRDGGFIYFFNGKLEGKYTSPIAHGCFFGMCCDLVVVIKVAMGSVWFDICLSLDRIGQDAKYHNWSLNVHNYKHILIFVYHIYTSLGLTEEIYDYHMII